MPTVRMPISKTTGEGHFTRLSIQDWKRFRHLNWSRWNTGYAVRSRGEYRALHRAIMGLTSADKRWVDHIDRDRLNNVRSNLRIVEPGVNVQNQAGHRGSTSKYRGVHWNRQARKWRAVVYVNGKRAYYGQFDDEDAAGEAAREAREKYLPFAID